MRACVVKVHKGALVDVPFLCVCLAFCVLLFRLNKNPGLVRLAWFGFDSGRFAFRGVVE